jgi:Ca2+-binding RTX toxin-like protein
VIATLVMLLPGVAQAAPPGNDDFADATAVTEPLPFDDLDVDTTEATTEPDEPDLGDLGCGFGLGNTVWYSWSPSADATVTVNTFGSDFDTLLGVWQGTDLDSLSLVGCNDDARDGLQSQVVFLAEMGEEYRIQVGGFAGDSGSLDLHVRETTVGFVEGTVTDEVTTDGLESICVFVRDAVLDNLQLGITQDDGTYSIAVRPGEYLLRFSDECSGRDRYISEWFDDVEDSDDATEVEVTAGDVISPIDAALARGCPGWASFGVNQVVGTAASETLTGTANVDVICGFGGDDLLVGLGRFDVLLGGKGDDVLRGGDGGDLMFGGRGDDRLLGGNGRDQMFGEDGRDELLGGAGDDRLNGGRHFDVCAGGPGNDRARLCEVTRGIP